MRKPINFLIVNMAMSDLMLPIFLFPWAITEFYSDTWTISGPLGQALCKMLVFLPDVSTTVSIQSLVLIALDRFSAVLFPFRSPLISPKLCPFFILATWLVAMLIHSPYLFVFKVVEYSGKRMCAQVWNNISSAAIYFLVTFVINLYTPLVFIAFIYCMIAFKLKSQKIPGEQSPKAEQKRLKKERNVIRMAVAIVLGFAICWLPFSVILLLSYFPGDHTPDLSSGAMRYIWFICLFIARANCAVNPCICFIFSENYRQGLRNLLGGFFAMKSNLRSKRFVCERCDRRSRLKACFQNTSL